MTTAHVVSSRWWRVDASVDLSNESSFVNGIDIAVDGGLAPALVTGQAQSCDSAVRRVSIPSHLSRFADAELGSARASNVLDRRHFVTHA